MYEHRHGVIDGFTKKYRVRKLIYYETFRTPIEAISAEKKIEGWTRRKKLELIISNNPTFQDLCNEQ